MTEQQPVLQDSTEEFVDIVDVQAEAPDEDTPTISKEERTLLAEATRVLAELYHEFQDTLTVVPASTDGSLKTLVTFDDAKTTPIHRWYTFKEGYSYQLLPWLQQQEIVPTTGPLHILDPFCGVATTLLASQRNPAVTTATGVEHNPAIRFIGQAKINWWSYRIPEVERLLVALDADTGRGNQRYPIPALSTFTTVRNGRRGFEPDHLQDMLYYREWITTQCEGLPEEAFFMLAWTAIIEEVSNTRKDGRALRLLDPVETLNVKHVLTAQANLMLADLRTMESIHPGAATTIHAGDARDLPFDAERFNTICYSPPYLNNIEYSEVYKLELWLRGDVTTSEAFRDLRLGTFRSHPSLKFPVTTICDDLDEDHWLRRLKAALLASVPHDRYYDDRKELFSGYIDDTLLALREQARVAQPGTPIICVVGNSLHGGDKSMTVCTDLLIAAAAQAVGLEVERLQIARQLPRRDNQNGWLRETIIVMRKPERPAQTGNVP